jgi:hypothetical protein
MNDITTVKVHPSGNHAISTALQDRSLILWRVGRSSGLKNSGA